MSPRTFPSWLWRPQGPELEGCLESIKSEAGGYSCEELRQTLESPLIHSFVKVNWICSRHSSKCSEDSNDQNRFDFLFSRGLYPSGEDWQGTNKQAIVDRDQHPEKNPKIWYDGDWWRARLGLRGVFSEKGTFWLWKTLGEGHSGCGNR